MSAASDRGFCVVFLGEGRRAKGKGEGRRAGSGTAVTSQSALPKIAQVPPRNNLWIDDTMGFVWDLICLCCVHFYADCNADS